MTTVVRKALERFNWSVSKMDEGTSSINAVKTAAELRRELHTLKARDREAVAEATNSTTPMSFFKTRWATALATGLITFFLLYLTNPLFVQAPTTTGARVTPSLRRVVSWSVLVAIIVALGPYVYQKFLPK